MKILFFCAALLLLPLTLYAVDVTIQMQGLRNDKGYVIIGVYPDAKTFENPRDAAYYDNKVVIANGKAIATFDLPAGSYAISMFHDENSNEELDLSFIRIPKEGWGFSRDAKPSPTWPDFEDAAFEVEKTPVSLTINVRYGIL